MIIQSYNDICLEIDGLTERIADIKTSIKYYQKLMHKDAPKEMSGMQYSDMPKGGHNYMSLDRILAAIGKLESHLVLAEESLKCKEQSRDSIGQILGRMEGIEYQVFYWRVVKKKTQEETAEIMNKSDRQVRRIEKKYINSI